jgi:hypothetical protein
MPAATPEKLTAVALKKPAPPRWVFLPSLSEL